jgi:hypothetical protein
MGFTILLAPCKPLVEYCFTALGGQNRGQSLGHPTNPRSSLVEGVGNLLDHGEGSAAGLPHTKKNRGKHSRRASDDVSKSDEATTMPIWLQFYARTTWYALALPIVGSSYLLVVAIMFVSSALGERPQSAVPTELSAWFFIFAPLQGFLFILGAMIVYDRTTSPGSQKFTYSVTSAVFTIISVAAALDTMYGIGGYPVSYIGMATSGLAATIYLFYGYVAHATRDSKGKGLAGRGGDEESPLLEPAASTITRPRSSKRPRQSKGRGRRGYGTTEGASRRP